MEAHSTRVKNNERTKKHKKKVPKDLPRAVQYMSCILKLLLVLHIDIIMYAKAKSSIPEQITEIQESLPPIVV
jgi:hypothetical protein